MEISKYNKAMQFLLKPKYLTKDFIIQAASDEPLEAFDDTIVEDSLIKEVMPYQSPEMQNVMPSFKSMEDPRNRQIELATGGVVQREQYAEGKGFFSDLIKENISPEYRMYAKSILPGGKQGNVDESYFTEDFKKDLRQQSLTKFNETGKLKGSVGELDTHFRSGAKKYGQGERYDINKIIGLPSSYATLGSYNYEVNPDNLDVKIKDKYDWNPAYGKNQEGKTGWVGNKKGKDVSTSMIKNYLIEAVKTGEMDLGDALELIGNYLGPKASKGEGINVDIDIPTRDIVNQGETFATGGRVGLEKGSKPPKDNFTIPINPMMEEGIQDPSKRGFLKGAGAVGIGAVAFGTGLLKLVKKGSKKLKDIEIDLSKLKGDWEPDYDGGYIGGYMQSFGLKATTKKGEELLAKLAKEKKIDVSNKGDYTGYTNNIDDASIDALEEIKNKTDYSLSFEGKKFKNKEEASDFLRGENSPWTQENPYQSNANTFLTEEAEHVTDLLAPKPIKQKITETINDRIRKIERESKATGGRVGLESGKENKKLITEFLNSTEQQIFSNFGKKISSGFDPTDVLQGLPEKEYQIMKGAMSKVGNLVKMGVRAAPELLVGTGPIGAGITAALTVPFMIADLTEGKRFSEALQNQASELTFGLIPEADKRIIEEIGGPEAGIGFEIQQNIDKLKSLREDLRESESKPQENMMDPEADFAQSTYLDNTRKELQNTIGLLIPYLNQRGELVAPEYNAYLRASNKSEQERAYRKGIGDLQTFNGGFDEMSIPEEGPFQQDINKLLKKQEQLEKSYYKKSYPSVMQGTVGEPVDDIINRNYVYAIGGRARLEENPHEFIENKYGPGPDYKDLKEYYND